MDIRLLAALSGVATGAEKAVGGMADYKIMAEKWKHEKKIKDALLKKHEFDMTQAEVELTQKETARKEGMLFLKGLMKGRDVFGEAPTEAPMGMPTGEADMGIDMDRPIIKEQGGFATEKSITIESNGKFINVPTIINGQQVSDEEATQHAFKTGEILGEFNTQEEAVRAAQTRSDRIGQLRGEEAGIPYASQMAAGFPDITYKPPETGLEFKFKRPEEKAYKPTTREEKLSYEKELADIKAQIKQKYPETKEIKTDEEVKRWAWSKYQKGNRAPEIKKVLDMYIAPPAQPFTAGAVQKTLGELESGGATTIYGDVIEFSNRKAAINHVTRKFGPNWKDISPDAEEIINRKWPEGDRLKEIKAQYKIGQIIPKGKTKYKIVGFDTDGEPLVEEIR